MAVSSAVAKSTSTTVLLVAESETVTLASSSPESLSVTDALPIETLGRAGVVPGRGPQSGAKSLVPGVRLRLVRAPLTTAGIVLIS